MKSLANTITLTQSGKLAREDGTDQTFPEFDGDKGIYTSQTKLRAGDAGNKAIRVDTLKAPQFDMTVGTGDLWQPRDVTVTATHIYVIDVGLHKLFKFDLAGVYVGEVGGIGAGDGQFNQPAGVSHNELNDDIWVADTVNNRLQRFDLNLNWISTHAMAARPIGIYVDGPGNRIYTVNDGTNRMYIHNLTTMALLSTISNNYYYPYSVYVDKKKIVWIGDSWHNHVQEFFQLFATHTLHKRFTSWGKQGYAAGAGECEFATPYVSIGENQWLITSQWNYNTFSILDLLGNGAITSQASGGTNPAGNHIREGKAYIAHVNGNLVRVWTLSNTDYVKKDINKNIFGAGQWFQFNGGSDAQCIGYYFGSTSGKLEDSQGIEIRYFGIDTYLMIDDNAALGTFSVPPIKIPIALSVNTWYYFKIAVTAIGVEVWVLDANDDIIFYNEFTGWTIPAGSIFYRYNWGDTDIYADELIVTDTNTLKITNLTATIAVNVLDPTTNDVIKSDKVNLGETEMNLDLGEISFPKAVKIEIRGTDGSVLLNEPVTLYGGDEYAYAGIYVQPQVQQYFEVKSEIQSLMMHLCDIYRQTSATNSLTGIVAETFSLLTENVKCLIQPWGGEQSLEFQGMEIDSSHIGFFLFDTDIKEGDRVKFNNDNYDVKHIEKNYSGYSHHLEVLMKLEQSTISVHD